MSTTPEAAQAQVSSLPLPPVQYINVYTDENVKRGRAPKPPPPVHDSYKMFGNTYSTDDAIIRPLETQHNIGNILAVPNLSESPSPPATLSGPSEQSEDIISKPGL
ncbi:Mediator of RNA polymerase II transcription subunit 7 [Homalodisca vitripennis]|nr:Mediator of RNA polymerase II transcription subunit 7 [Homalodisca vitripennis]